MTSLRAHRIRAVTSTLADGAAMGALLAVRAAPPWSRSRVLTAAAAAVLLLADQLSQDLPPLLRAVRTVGEVGPVPPEEHRALRDAAVRAAATGLGLQLLERPVVRTLTDRGVAHPHRWFGVAGAIAQVAAMAPVHWRRAADRARREAELDAAIEAELQEMAAGR